MGRRAIRRGERGSWRWRSRPARWATPWPVPCFPTVFAIRQNRKVIPPESAVAVGNPFPWMKLPDCLQIRDRKASEEERRGTKKAGFWREDKVGCLLSVSSAVFAEDPCPQIPETLLDLGRIRKISREIKGLCVPDEEESPRDEAVSQRRAGQPEVLVRSVVATREDIHAFGKQLAAAAWQRGFSAAPRKAFVADGQDANWTVWRKHFSHTWKTRSRGCTTTPTVAWGCRSLEAISNRRSNRSNRRVKGTEKFWSEGGAEALLQLAADYLSETNPLATLWRERPGRATGQRHYQIAG
jgi:hypothetical protein